MRLIHGVDEDRAKNRMDFPKERWVKIPTENTRYTYYFSDYGRLRREDLIILDSHWKNPRTAIDIAYFTYEEANRKQKRVIHNLRVAELFLIYFPSLVYGDWILNHVDEEWKPYPCTFDKTLEFSNYGRVRRRNKAGTLSLAGTPHFKLMTGYGFPVRWYIKGGDQEYLFINTQKALMEFFPEDFEEIVRDDLYELVVFEGEKFLITNNGLGLISSLGRSWKRGKHSFYYEEREKPPARAKTADGKDRRLPSLLRIAQSEGVGPEEILKDMIKRGLPKHVKPFSIKLSSKKAYKVFDTYLRTEEYFNSIAEISKEKGIPESIVLRLLSQDIDSFKNLKVYFNNITRGVRDARKY